MSAAVLDRAKIWVPEIQVHKWDASQVDWMVRRFGREPVYADFVSAKVEPAQVMHDRGNALTTVGLALITSLLTAAGGNAFTTTTTGIGVGATATAFNTAQVALAGNGNSTTAWYQLVDASPGVSRQSVTTTNDSIQAVATFASADANFAWNEWCLVTGSGTFTSGNAIASLSAGTETMVNRKVVSLGTKASGTVWALTTTITLL